MQLTKCTANCSKLWIQYHNGTYPTQTSRRHTISLLTQWYFASPYIVVNQELLKNTSFFCYYCCFYNRSRMVKSCTKYQTPVVEGAVTRTDAIQDEMHIFCLSNMVWLFKTKLKISKCGYHKNSLWNFIFIKKSINKQHYCVTKRDWWLIQTINFL